MSRKVRHRSDDRPRSRLSPRSAGEAVLAWANAADPESGVFVLARDLPSVLAKPLPKIVKRQAGDVLFGAET